MAALGPCFEKIIMGESNTRIFAIFQDGDCLSKLIRSLLSAQKKDWPDLNKNYSWLEKQLCREIRIDGFPILLHFNPARIRSTAANPDIISLGKRKCFLCRENLPLQQKAILYKNRYLILCNPYPIFPEHFTIASLEHEPQNIGSLLEGVFRLASELGERYTIFYNGPRCGASAPDHLHLQVCTSGIMPIEIEFTNRKGSSTLKPGKPAIRIFENVERAVIGLEAVNVETASRGIGDIAADLNVFFRTDTMPSGAEPMLNLIAKALPGGDLGAMVFIRRKFRPDCYFREGQGKVLVSPASVEMGGIIVLPREEDFHKIEADLVRSILKEVCYDRKTLGTILKRLL